jgi:hypothetical protein
VRLGGLELIVGFRTKAIETIDFEGLAIYVEGEDDNTGGGAASSSAAAAAGDDEAARRGGAPAQRRQPILMRGAVRRDDVPHKDSVCLNNYA